MSNLIDAQLAKRFRADQQSLADTQVPILIYSSVVRSGKVIGQSRTQLALALTVAEQFWGARIQADKAWITDASASMSSAQWSQLYHQTPTKQSAVNSMWLSHLKSWLSGVDAPPTNPATINTLLLYLTKSIERPIVSFSSILSELLLNQGKQVIHVVSDATASKRLLHLGLHPNVMLIVFDQNIKHDLVEQAELTQQPIDARKIEVVQLPVIQRLLSKNQRKLAWRSGSLRLLVDASGNFSSASSDVQLVKQLVRGVAHLAVPIKLLLYCGTDTKTAQKLATVVQQARLTVAPLADTQAPIRLIADPSLTLAEQQLDQLGWRWAHGCLCSPTVDWLAAAVASSNFLLTKPARTDWEADLVRQLHTLGVSTQVHEEHVLEQLESLMRAGVRGQSWIERAMHTSHRARAQLTGTQQITKLITDHRQLESNLF